MFLFLHEEFDGGVVVFCEYCFEEAAMIPDELSAFRWTDWARELSP